MRVFLTGGTGFLGTHLVAALTARGDSCVVVSRAGRDRWRTPLVRVVTGDPTVPGAWQREVDGADAVINLAGEPIVKPPLRWTAARKALLRSSRVEVTRQVVRAIREADRRPAVLVNASAVGYYGSRGDTALAEDAAPGSGFLADLATAWEGAAREAADVARVVLLRSGIVLGTDGGALPPLLRPFRLGVGGPWGSGQQWWPWIHVDDAIGLALGALAGPLAGPLNVVAPGIVTVREFAAALGAALGRPALLPLPALALRLALGEAATALLDSIRAVPRRAEEAGHAFRFPAVAAALADLLPRPR